MRDKMLIEREVIQLRLEHLEARLRAVLAARARARDRARDRARARVRARAAGDRG